MISQKALRWKRRAFVYYVVRFLFIKDIFKQDRFIIPQGDEFGEIPTVRFDRNVFEMNVFHFVPGYVKPLQFHGGAKEFHSAEIAILLFHLCRQA